MTSIGYVNEVMRIGIRTEITGATDVQVDIFQDGGAITTLDLTEVTAGGSGQKIYDNEHSFTATGFWYLVFHSTTIAAVEGQATMVKIEEHSKTDLAGAGYDGATDSLAAVAEDIRTIKGTTGSPKAQILVN